MSDKPKYFYVPQSFSENKSLKYFTTTRLLSQPNLSLNTQMTSYQKTINPVGSSFATKQCMKNLSANIAQFHDRMDNLVVAMKKQETTVFSDHRNGNDTFQLRSSVPMNIAKKPDIQFLRNTTFTPKPKGIFFGQHDSNNQHYPQSSDNKTSIEHISSSFKFDKYITKNEIKKNQKKQIQKFSKQTKQIKTPNTPLPYSPPSTHISHTINMKLQTKVEVDQKKHQIKSSKNMINGFYIGKSLGVGKFAQVFLVKHQTSGFICVLKKLSKQKIKQYKMQSQVIQQIKIHAFISHPNIVQFYGIFDDEKHIYMILEYLQSGTLFDYLGDKSYLEQKQAVVFLRQISMAVKYLHNKGIAHRDIKPQNIIISYGLAKLCDFGWSARVLGTRKTYCGTFDYAPPEILQRKQYDQTVDLWCIGVLAYQLLTNKVPFEHKQRKITMQKILNVDKDKIVFPQNISVRAKDFIESLIRKNPQQRLKAYKLLDHPFLKQYEQQL